jgi:WD40 repeat protein
MPGAILTMIHPRCQAKALFLLAAISVGLLAASGSHVTFAEFPQAKEPADEKTIRDLIKQLGDDAFDKREDAAKRLAAIGEPALTLLQQAAKDNPDAEVRQRALELVQSLGSKSISVVKTFKPTINSGVLVTRVVLTSDAKQIVTAGKGPPIVWEIATGKESGSPQGGKGNFCFALAVSPDGQRALIGCVGKLGHLYDLPSGKKLQQLTGHTAEVRGAAFLPDGKTALTGSLDQTIRIWDLESGAEVRSFAGITDKVSCLTVSPDGKMVAAGHFTKSGGPAAVRLWDLEQGAVIRSMPGHTQEVTSVAFSPDGKSLLSGSFDRTVRLWDVATGKELKRFEGTGRVENAAFTPDGKRIVSCGDASDSRLHLWDIQSGQQILQSEAVGRGITGLAVLPDGRRCVTAGNDDVIRIWEWKK